MWKTVKLGEALKTGAGGTPLKSQKVYYEGGTIKWLLSGAVCEKDIHDSKTHITEDGLANSSAKLFPKNTVLVAMYGATAGQVGILRTEAATNQAVCGIYPSDDYSPEFLYYYLTNYKETLLLEVSGVAQPNLSQIKIKNIPLPLISLAEQQRIVAKLDAAFAEIDRAIEIACSKEAELSSFKSSALDNIFQNLSNETKMGQVFEFVRGPFGGSLTKNMFTEEGFAVYEQQHAIRNQCSDFRYYVPREKYDEMSRFRVRPNAILMSCSGTIGKTTIVPESFVEGIINQALLMLNPNSKILSKFAIFYMQSSRFSQQLLERVEGAAQKNVASVKVLKEILIPLPSVEEQHRLVASIENLLSEISHNQEIAKTIKTNYTQLKSAILAQELKPSEAA